LFQCEKPSNPRWVKQLAGTTLPVSTEDSDTWVYAGGYTGW